MYICVSVPNSYAIVDRLRTRLSRIDRASDFAFFLSHFRTERSLRQDSILVSWLAGSAYSSVHRVTRYQRVDTEIDSVLRL